MHACTCLQAFLTKALSHDIEERPAASELRSVLESLIADIIDVTSRPYKTTRTQPHGV